MDNAYIGKLGEEIAQKHLAAKGYHILQKNFRAKQYGEVDLLTQSPNGQTLIFVEVKTRVGTEFGRSEEAVTKSKLGELKKMVAYFYNQYPETKLSPQIDVVAITLNADETVLLLEHFENVTL